MVRERKHKSLTTKYLIDNRGDKQKNDNGGGIQ